MSRVFITAVSLVLVPRVAIACPVCFGNNDSPLANAMNLGILAMLGVVAAVLSGFAAFIVHLNRRARLVNGEPEAVAAGASLTTTAPQEGSAQC